MYCQVTYELFFFFSLKTIAWFFPITCDTIKHISFWFFNGFTQVHMQECILVEYIVMYVRYLLQFKKKKKSIYVKKPMLLDEKNSRAFSDSLS